MRRSLVAVAAVLVALLSGLQARAQQPDPHRDPLVDGCQRHGIGIITLTAPEWQYVNKADVIARRAMGDRTAGNRTVEGVVSDVHPAGDDEFYNHDFNDLDVDIVPDAATFDVVEKGGTSIGLEWEEALVPMWAWPHIGDRVKATGSHIWDCGHWGNGPADPTPGDVASLLIPGDPIETAQDLVAPGTIHGEQTEIHPPYELATIRSYSSWAGVLAGTPSVMSRLDAWISADGGWAYAEEECALAGLPPASNHACTRFRHIGGTYSYTLDIGPRPAGGAFVYNPPVVHAESTVTSGGVSVAQNPLNEREVTVSFTLPDNADPVTGAAKAAQYGLTVEAGWTNQTVAVVRRTVTLDSLTIRHSLEGKSEPNLNPVTSALQGNGDEIQADPAEWVAFANVNGAWQQVPPAALASVHEPAAGETEVVPLGVTFDVWLRAGQPLRVFFSTRECDIPLIDCASDVFGGSPQVAFAELGYNDHPGRIRTSVAGEAAHLGRILPSLGTYVLSPGYNPNKTANEDLSDWSCRTAAGAGEPCYDLRVTVSS